MWIATLDGIESDEDELAAKKRRDDELVANASMDELAGSWLREERGDDGEVTAADTRSVACLGAGGTSNAHAEAEATEKAQFALVRSGRGHEACRRERLLVSHDTLGGSLADEREWTMKVRLVAQEYKWVGHRENFFSPGATHSTEKGIALLALKLGLDTFEADAVDAYFPALEHEEVIVEPAPEYLTRLEAAGKNTDIVWRLRRQLPGRRPAGRCGVGAQTGYFPLRSGTTVLMEH